MQGVDGQTYHNTLSGQDAPFLRANCTINVDSNMIVSYITGGEWMAYTLTGAPGLYDVNFMVSGAPPTTAPLSMFLTLDASCTLSKAASFKDDYFTTGNYGWWKSVYAGRVQLPGGQVTARICFEIASYMQFKGFSLTNTGSQPYLGIPQTVPGTIAANLFDTGGEGIAYHKINTGQPQVRSDATVAGSSKAISYINPGEWVKYTVIVASAGSWNVAYMLAGVPSVQPILSLLIAMPEFTLGTHPS